MPPEPDDVLVGDILQLTVPLPPTDDWPNGVAYPVGLLVDNRVEVRVALVYAIAVSPRGRTVRCRYLHTAGLRHGGFLWDRKILPSSGWTIKRLGRDYQLNKGLFGGRQQT